MSPATATSPVSSPAATTDSVPRRPSSAMAPDLPTGSSASGTPEPQTLPFFLSPPPPPPPPPPPLRAGHRLLQPLPPPPGPIVLRLHPAFVAEMDCRRSHSLVQFLKDEGAVPSPEEDKKREQVIRKLKKIVMDWAKVVAYEQRVPPRRATATVLTYGSYTLGAHGPESDIDALCVGPCIATLQKFQVLLRCIKLWARRRGLHCHLLGFFAGIHLAILAAYVCQRNPDASVNGLFTMFFEIFAHWPWQNPVSLHGQPTNRRRSDGCLMAIVMPCTPPEFCGSNMTKGTFKKIREELMRGYALTKDLWRHEFEWIWLFAPFPYATKYEQFLCISLCAPTSEELRDWAGWVKSRFRYLIPKLEAIGIDCDPDSSEEIDHTVIKPNIVYHWGLISQSSSHINTSSLKEDFMKDVINDAYGKVKCTHSELTMSIVELSQLPKSMYSHSVYSRYLPQYMLVYQASTDGRSAVG